MTTLTSGELLKYFFSSGFYERVCLKILVFNPFVPNARFLYPLKTENLKFSDVFRGRERVHWEQME